jgi:hypothetical protein
LIYINLVGGLGNQLFQYSAGLMYASFEKDNILLDDSNTDTTSISLMLPGLTFARKDDIKKKFGFSGNTPLDLFLKRLYKLAPSFFRSYRYWSSPKDTDMECQYRKNIYLDGYWQDYSLMKKTIPHIRELVQLPSLSDSFHKLNIEMQSTKSISIHVRRGDYASEEFKDKFDVCDVEYYQRCLSDLFPKIDKNTKVYFFTNDTEWVENNLLELISNYAIVSRSRGLMDFEELLLMGNSENIIIPNSTFSWWGAVLANEPSRVYCPISWFKNFDRPEIIPEHWIRM